MQYITLSPIKRDGQTIAPGAQIELSDSEAEPLLMDGAIKPAGRPTEFTIRASASRPVAQVFELSAPHRN